MIRYLNFLDPNILDYSSIINISNKIVPKYKFITLPYNFACIIIHYSF